MPATQDNLDLPYEQRLAIYRTSLSAARAEIIRSKQVYAQEAASGATVARLSQINAWATQVRIAAGIPEDDPTYGNSPFIGPIIQQSITDLYAGTDQTALKSSSANDSQSGLQKLNSQSVSDFAGLALVIGGGIMAFSLIGKGRGRHR